MKKFMKKFKPVRRKNGGFGHSTAKYSKNPRVRLARELEARTGERKVTPIRNPARSVRAVFQVQRRVVGVMR